MKESVPRAVRLAESEELQIETAAASAGYADSWFALSSIACLVLGSREASREKMPN
jgi:hypothetical protein